MQLPPLVEGILIARYKRFLADIKLGDGSVVTAHCPNSGSMRGCAVPGSRVMLSHSQNPKRKLAYTWELVEINGGWVGINTSRTNAIVEEALQAEMIPELAAYPELRREVPYGNNSRIDLLLESESGRCYVEVKSVTLDLGGMASFPDAVTIRGQKHMHELTSMVKQGHAAAVLFLVQRSDVKPFTPASEIDPAYAEALRQARDSGVKVLVYGTRISPQSICLDSPMAVQW